MRSADSCLIPSCEEQTPGTGSVQLSLGVFAVESLRVMEKAGRRAGRPGKIAGMAMVMSMVTVTVTVTVTGDDGRVDCHQPV